MADPVVSLSRTEARYLLGSMTYGVVWEQMYGMFRKLASPEFRAFTTCMRDDMAIHGGACYLPDCIGHLYECRPPPPSDIMPGDRRRHWLPIALDGTSKHEAWYVHCMPMEPPAPTNYLVGGYSGAVKNGRPSTQAQKKQILMMSCARTPPEILRMREGMIGSPFFYCVHMGKRRCSWQAAKTGRQNPPEPRCAESACGTVLFALLPLAH